MYVSVSPIDFRLDKLVCLSRALREQKGNERELVVSLFDSPYAAADFQPSPMIELSRANRESFKHLRATYVSDAAKQVEYLDVQPLGYAGSDKYDSHIDLAVVTTVHCRLELDDRCVLGFDSGANQHTSPRVSASGAVRLNATIGRDGRLARVRVERAASVPAARKTLLITAAIDNLKTWWFEPSTAATDVSIDYTSNAGAGLLEDAVDLRVELQNQVFITFSRKK